MWRFNTYAGGWRVPVHTYRNWMEHDLTLRDEVRRYSEIMDAIPMLGVFGTGSLRAEHVEVHNLLELARGWQHHYGFNADVNEDGKVNIFDLVLVGQNFGVSFALPQADLDGDGLVNVLDLIFVTNMFEDVIATK